MTFKTIEIRDSMTRIDAVAFRMVAENPIQDYYVHSCAGHPRDGRSIVLMRTDNLRATNDPWEWASLTGSERTMQTAHCYILENFDRLSDGDVVDVEFILGETTAPKISERLPEGRWPR